MRVLNGCTLAAVLFTSALSAGARPAKAPTANPVSADYVQAVGAASHFLAAWVWRDQDRGLLTVSARLKKLRTNGQLRDYFSGVSNPGHQGYEILPGKKISSIRYAFPVRLYEYYTGDKQPQRKPPMGRLVVVRDKTAPEGWAVDNLPGYSLHKSRG